MKSIGYSYSAGYQILSSHKFEDFHKKELSHRILILIDTATYSNISGFGKTS